MRYTLTIILCLFNSIFAQIDNSSIELWLSSSSTSLLNDTIYDYSPNKTNAVVDNGNILSTQTINGTIRKSLKFIDNKYKALISINTSSEYSLIFFFKPNKFNSSQQNFLNGTGSTTSRIILPIIKKNYSSIGRLGPKLYGNEFDYDTASFYMLFVSVDDSVKIQINDKIISKEKYTPFSYGSTLFIGSSNLNCNFYDFIILNKSIDSIEINNIQNTLANKTFYPPNLGNDTTITQFTSCPININFNTTNFPGPYEWSTGETSSSIDITEPGEYWVRAKNNYGFWLSDTIKITTEYTFRNDTTICQLDTLIWNTQLTKNGYNFLWDDGSTDSINKITDAGIHWVEISNNFGCSYRDTVILSIDSFPTQTSLGPDKPLCEGESLELKTGQEDVISYLWSNGSNDSYIPITSSGEYTVTCTNTIGCIAKDTINITVSGRAPIPNLSYTNQCNGDFTSFTDISSPESSSIDSWLWIFGDGDSSQVQNPNHQYADTGLYVVRLEIENSDACQNFIDTAIRIYPLPNVSMTYGSLCHNTINEFISTSTIDRGIINTQSWTFNGINIVNDTAEYFLADTGNTTIRLTAESDQNCFNTIIQPIYILGSPLVDFDFIPKCVGDPIAFIPEVNTSFSGTVSLVWNFDGEVDFSQGGTNYIFNNSGDFVCSLSATRTDGLCEKDTSKTVTILDYPTIGYYFNNPCTDQFLKLVDTSKALNSKIVHRRWTLPNIGSSNDSISNFLLGNQTSQLVNLEVANEYWCYKDSSSIITIQTSPSSNFMLTPTIGESPLEVVFTNLSINSNNYYWDFDDSNTSTEVSPTHTYTSNNNYLPKLVAYNNNGCSDTSSQMLQVLDPMLDLNLKDIFIQNIGENLAVTVNVENIGNIPIEEIRFLIKIGMGQSVISSFNGYIAPNSDTIFTLNTLILKQNALENYLCVEAKVMGDFSEENLGNNNVCKSFNEDVFTLYQIYPNPTSNILNSQFYSPIKQSIQINVVDEIGNFVFTQNEILVEKGLNKLQIDVKNLSSGIYYLKVKEESDTHIQKFTIIK